MTLKTKKDLKPVLMQGAKGSIKTPYYLIREEEQLIFVVTPGKNGSEYNKTVGYFSNFAGMQSYQCLYGQGIMVMQRNDESGEAKEFKIVSLNPGRGVVVPAGWGMCMVNTGTNFLVVIRNSLLDENFEDSNPILEKRGFAYYIVEKKGEISFEQNPNYSVHPQISTE
ncbi:MAG: Uncharacterized protein G01um10147_890 [Microgenomates group bacterium Gr01-1014_7]|nr:MAG: Uncharacterized protein G01um10147_890 [Microgenomates group bacterium Gr01-1014_7]